MNFEIEKGIPIPQVDRPSNGFTDALRKMEVGDSFVAPRKLQNVICASAKQGGFPERKFTSRKISDTEIRIWRTA